MTTNSRIPPLLEPYIASLPEDSLILLTSTLGTSANWITTRYLCSSLANNADKTRRSASTLREYGDLKEETSRSSASRIAKDATDEGYAVVLVSWMRNWDFWKVEARRAAGLDLTQLSQSKRLAFVDGLTGLYSFEPPALNPQPSPNRETPAPSPTIPARRPIPLRQPPGSTRGPMTAEAAPSLQTFPAQAAQPTLSNIFRLKTTDIPHTRSVIEEAIDSLSLNTSSQSSVPASRKIILILDAPDVLLSLQAPTSAPTMTIQSLLFNLRSNSLIHSTIVSLTSDINAPPSDLPAGHIPSQLEINTQAFLVGTAHEADLIVGCRGLDTGGAGDVSGVVRITKGAEDESESRQDWKEQELLYFVKGDGDVKVWERSAGVG
ncbi:hypothetical protein FKW77_002577 [Venturia effusa]|uniref:Elongator complex protein 5 n=1 Tax=Venturia effusa TaxID=50376 RepID=A0A517LAI6_9PEZI|nr:hypothetical protein FKW77_002577 [Venturia effusa]